MDYVIYTDASADVDAGFLARSGVKFVQMRYMVGEEERICNSLEKEAFLKKFYDAQREGKATQTSQIAPSTYVEEFEPVLREGKSVLYISLSSGLTKTFDSVQLAARELAETYAEAKVVPVDSYSATGGMGLLVEMAVANKEKGMSVEENAKWLQENCRKVLLAFMVDDLMYLKRGGRIPASTAILGTALNIKPLLEVDTEGKLVTVEKKRGVKAALKALVTKYAQTMDKEISNRVYIVHGDCEERAEELAQMVREVNPNADITRMMLCPVIGSHTGPGMVAVIYWGTR